MIKFRHISKYDKMIKSSIRLLISDSEDPLNDIKTPDLLPNLLDSRYFKFKMSEQYYCSEDAYDQELINDLFNIIQHPQQSQVSNLSQELTISTVKPEEVHNFSDPQIVEIDAIQQFLQMDELMTKQEPIAQIVPTINDPQSIGFPQTVLPIDSELSQTSTDSELNYPFSHLSTTSPQSQDTTHTPVMSRSPQMNPFDPNSSQAFMTGEVSGEVSRPRMHSMSYPTQSVIPEQRPTGRLSFDEASHQTRSELPRFGQIFNRGTGFNTGISQLYNPSMVANQPMQSSCAINITPQHSNTIIHSYSVPTYPYVSDNRSDFPIRSTSEPELLSSQTITPYGRRVRTGRGKRAGAALKRREAEDLMNNLENHNYSLKEAVDNLQQQVNYYKAMLPLPLPTLPN